jgi:hypothetical protein
MPDSPSHAVPEDGRAPALTHYKKNAKEHLTRGQVVLSFTTYERKKN